MSDSGIVVGVLDTPAVAFVNPLGALAAPDAGVELDWRVHTDRWHSPAPASTRQHAVDGLPVVETRVAVPGGDVVQHVYAAAGTPAMVLIEFENASPNTVAVAVVIEGASHAALAIPDTSAAAGRLPVTVRRDGRAVLVASRAWREVTDEVERVAFVWPLPHRASLRLMVPLRVIDAMAADVALEPGTRPSAADVARGWSAQLSRGARVEVADSALQAAVDGARAALLLLAGRESVRPDADTVIALEDWGLDTEATSAWYRLSMRARHRAGRRTCTDDAWSCVQAELRTAPGGVPAAPAPFLRALRDVLILDTDDRRGIDIEVCPGFPPAWLGLAISVHSMPTRRGLVSYALRWHDARPAVLWTAPPGVTLTAPALDPKWSSASPSGEALLAAPGDQLLRLSTTTSPDGESVTDPGSFT